MIQTYKNIFTGLHGFSMVIIILFLLIYFIRILYLFLFTGRILFRKPTKITGHSFKPFSILLTIRNDEDSLRKYLPSLLTIDGVDYEVIVYDDYTSGQLQKI